MGISANSPILAQNAFTPFPRRTGVAVMEIDSPHTRQVEGVMRNMGVTPTTVIGLQSQIQRVPQTPQQYIVFNTVDKLDEVSGHLNRLARDPNNNIGVVNVSYGLSASGMYGAFFQRYNNDAQFRQMTDQQLRLNGNMSPFDRNQAIFNYIDNVMQTNPDIRAAMGRYENATRLASERGITVVTAALNEQQKLDADRQNGYTFQDGAGFNLLGRSPYVISVGAIDDKGTRTTADDTAAPFSSAGNGRFGPTVAANGINVNGNDDNDGTSFSTPQVSATVARMLQANPNLTNQQIQAILRGTAFDNPNISNRVEGAGTVQVDAAIAEARRLAGNADNNTTTGGVTNPENPPGTQPPANNPFKLPDQINAQTWNDARTQRRGTANSLSEVISQSIGANAQTYQIQYGDTLTDIVRALQGRQDYAGTGNVTQDLEAIRKANPNITDINRIQAGASLNLNGLVKPAETTTTGENPPPTVQNPPKGEDPPPPKVEEDPPPQNPPNVTPRRPREPETILV